jgi:hypothetical protein
MHSHAAVMEKNIRRQNQDDLIIPKHTLNARVFTLGGNPLSCYNMMSSHVTWSSWNMTIFDIELKVFATSNWRTT